MRQYPPDACNTLYIEGLPRAWGWWRLGLLCMYGTGVPVLCWWLCGACRHCCICAAPRRLDVLLTDLCMLRPGAADVTRRELAHIFRAHEGYRVRSQLFCALLCS